MSESSLVTTERSALGYKNSRSWRLAVGNNKLKASGPGIADAITETVAPQLEIDMLLLA